MHIKWFCGMHLLHSNVMQHAVNCHMCTHQFILGVTISATMCVLYICEASSTCIYRAYLTSPKKNLSGQQKGISIHARHSAPHTQFVYRRVTQMFFYRQPLKKKFVCVYTCMLTYICVHSMVGVKNCSKLLLLEYINIKKKRNVKTYVFGYLLPSVSQSRRKHLRHDSERERDNCICAIVMFLSVCRELSLWLSHFPHAGRILYPAPSTRMHTEHSQLYHNNILNESIRQLVTVHTLESSVFHNSFSQQRSPIPSRRVYMKQEKKYSKFLLFIFAKTIL